MKTSIYSFLVNKQPGISARYHEYHDNASGKQKILSYFYLLWLNFAYYVLRIKKIGKLKGTEYYEEEKLITTSAESETYLKANPGLNVDAFVSKLSAYDIISFDIFDTLILRPLSQPTDVFWMIGEKMDVADMKRIRKNCEYEARLKRRDESGHMEISLDEVWDELARSIKVSPSDQQIETDIEYDLCYANPFMFEVWQKLKAAGKKFVITSDMYLPASFLEKMLEKNGYTGYEKLYVSNAHIKSKAAGDLYDLVRAEMEEKFGNNISFAHVGDNIHSDYEMAKKHGFEAIIYPKTDKSAADYRPYDMSYMIGSAYRAVVNNYLYNGLSSYSMEYEYGFIYAGLFVLGYCQFIHEYVKRNNIEKVLFLARDGEILKQVYDELFPEEDTVYAYWSRKAATKLMACRDRQDFFRRFIYHKVNQNVTLGKALESMELPSLISKLNTAGFNSDDVLTNNNSKAFQKFMEENWIEAEEIFEVQHEAAKKYYADMLSGVSKAVAVDIGWAGSGAMSLRYLTKEKWGIPCEVTGLIAGTNTVFNAEPDASEPFLQSGKLVSYLYSQSFNRDLLKIHDPNKYFNVYWELLLSSPTRKFNGFYNGKQEKEHGVYINDLDITLDFGKMDSNVDGIKEIQRGIKDFVSDYVSHFKKYPYMFNISGRDAYAPMLLAAGKNRKYLKAIDKKFNLEINVN